MWFPFDTQNCFVHLYITGDKVQLKVGNISYTGEPDLGKYYFKEINSCDVDKHGRNGIFVDITGMFLLISQLSTVFGTKFVEIVIEVNTTLLLVLTT